MAETSLVYLSRLIALERQLEVTAHNIANAETTGFRARGLSFQEYLRPMPPEDPGERASTVSLVVPHLQFNLVSKGSIRRTGNPLDLAIDGEGYFVVQTDRGERYTRSGEFGVDPTGRLVTVDGHVVLGKAGQVQIPSNEGTINVSADGFVSIDRRIIAQLLLVRFARPQQLEPVGGALFRSDQPPLGVTDRGSTILSGALEQSDVESTREMTRLSEIARNYEMVGQLIKSSLDPDDINKLAKVPD
ncbi:MULTISPECIES: flagellar hook-basal body complex protein [Bradyrhizobium]|uniref:flagellar hook-basal body complex protein n=1 Tax=Bradyrhizobium TaxID=374 RepID=UPI00155E0E4B|nr:MULTISPECIES: flagellar hook-basal body complex protein [Bradyrhizobium]MDD1522452.1 flagellar biosynthesis protein FlgG [Bradyrhizobium sp. WBAH30]MDD1546376.1 flagellar biosynthesis protein FlgG [Bradyrhizobium sp. WBAH41]MDD1560965.1 flagellar biosynthesis protein FlgG [Bradyrhizobium sp. WBAH23]MDD1567383.1 flagellar biosynthesis protein FlgG [Bradyrhizobium sp. WBAH33]MDD1594045.1 flagellar biosynthesis protein FlgG [Bradyrhizobium sp. WBAH42]